MLAQATTGIQTNGGLAMANARDNLKPPPTIQSRMKRLVDNFRENLWFFVPLVLIAAIAGISNQWTVLGVQIFFLAPPRARDHVLARLAVHPSAVLAASASSAARMIFFSLFGILV